MEKIYNHRILKGYIDFLDSKFGKPVTDQVLSKIQMDRMTLMDMNGFATDDEARILAEACMELTGEKNLSYLIGRNIVTSVGKLGGFVVGVTSPAIFLRSLGAVECRLALKTITKTTQINRNRYKIEVTYRDGYVPPVYCCDNRIGSYEAGPLFFGLPYAKVEHPRCLHRNEGDCQYFIQFPEHGFFIFKRIAQFLIIAAFIISILWFTGIHNYFIPLTAGLLVTFSAISYIIYLMFATKKAQEWSSLANDGADKQNRLLNRMYSQLASLQNLTTILQECSEESERWKNVVQFITDKFEYGSCQVWLLSTETNVLTCVYSKGYALNFQNTKISANNNTEIEWDNPHGYLIHFLENKKITIINDLADFLPRLSGKAQRYLCDLGLSSLIASPLIKGERVFGILIAEKYAMQKIDNQDNLVFQYISELVVNALV